MGRGAGQSGSCWDGYPVAVGAVGGGIDIGVHRQMHRIGIYALMVGAVLVSIGLLAGFGLLFGGYDDQARLLLGAVPFGFLIGFAGVVTTLLSGSDVNG